MRVFVAGLAVLVVLTLGACGGSTKTVTIVTQSVPDTASNSTTATSTASPTATSSTESSSTPTSTTTSTSSGPNSCRASGLALSFLGGQGATGHGELGFALRNVGTQSCGTVGFPGVLFLDRAGAALPTDSTRTTHDFFGSLPLAPLVIAPGASASFRLGVTHGISSSAGCTTAYGLQVIPPNDTATLRVSMPQGEYECGAATVSPLVPGQSAYP
jgi:hypothetical protein